MERCDFFLGLRIVGIDCLIIMVLFLVGKFEKEYYGILFLFKMMDY